MSTEEAACWSECPNYDRRRLTRAGLGGSLGVYQQPADERRRVCSLRLEEARTSMPTDPPPSGHPAARVGTAPLTRRRFIHALGIFAAAGAGTTLLAACGPAAPPAATPGAAGAAPTQ